MPKVTMNTYTHLSLDGAKDEMIRLEKLEQARKEINKAESKMPMRQNMFKVVCENGDAQGFRESLGVIFVRGNCGMR